MRSGGERKERNKTREKREKRDGEGFTEIERHRKSLAEGRGERHCCGKRDENEKEYKRPDKTEPEGLCIMCFEASGKKKNRNTLKEREIAYCAFRE